MEIEILEGMEESKENLVNGFLFVPFFLAFQKDSLCFIFFLFIYANGRKYSLNLKIYIPQYPF